MDGALLTHDLLCLILTHAVLIGDSGEVGGAQGGLGRGRKILITQLDALLGRLLQQDAVAHIGKNRVSGRSGVVAVLVLHAVKAVLALDGLTGTDLVRGPLELPGCDRRVELALGENGSAHALGAKAAGTKEIAGDTGDDHGDERAGDEVLVLAHHCSLHACLLRANRARRGGRGGGRGIRRGVCRGLGVLHTLGLGLAIGLAGVGGASVLSVGGISVGGNDVIGVGIQQLGIGLELTLGLGGRRLAGNVLGGQALVNIHVLDLIIAVRALTAADDLDPVDVLVILGIVLLHDQTHAVRSLHLTWRIVVSSRYDTQK